MRMNDCGLFRRLTAAVLLVTGLLSVSALAAPRLGAEDHTRWVEVQLNDGTKVVAAFVRSTRNSVTILENGAERQIDMQNVKVVNYLDVPPAAAEATTPAPAQTPAAPPAPPADPTVPPPSAGVVPDLQVPLPAAEATRMETLRVPLQWAKDGLGPWYKLNRASSLHQMPDWTRAETARETEILTAIDALPDPAAKKKLAGMQTEAAPYLVIFLLDTNPNKAEACAQLLLDRGNRDVTKYFIEALYATTAPNDKALAPWLQPYAKTLVLGCMKFTDTAANLDPAKAPFSAGVFVDAWKANFADAVPQLGEPAYKRDPQPANAEIQKTAWIAFFRTLALKRVAFGQPPEEKPDLTRKYPHVKDAALDKAIMADIDQLTAPKEQDREAAKASLQARNWPDIAPYLAQALMESPNVPLRLTILDMVSTQNDKAFTWHVVMALKNAWGSPNQVPGPNNAALIRISDAICRKLTGFTNQPAVQPTFIGGYKPVQGFIDYWNEHFKDFPAQYGEPELDKTAAKYNEYLKELRFIKTGEGAK
ncbi:MAG TPA: hypothetical protein VL860_01355 [Planctomycetota bacterium]|nr:hypothetical protein [Planctomycetota bacterium]